MKRVMIKPRRSLWQRMLRSLVSRHSSNEAIALGAAIGVFVAFTPTGGFQMAIAAFLATLFRANRAASLLGPWITNPVTFLPINILLYRVGSVIVPGPSAGQVYESLVGVAGSIRQMSWFAFHDHMKAFLMIGMEVFWPILIGGVIVGLFFGAVSYPVTLVLVRRVRRLRAARREHRLAQRRERLAQQGRPGDQTKSEG